MRACRSKREGVGEALCTDKGPVLQSRHQHQLRTAEGAFWHQHLKTKLLAFQFHATQ